ncbi:lipocalin [Saccharobesus litoralis]|uniref:Outer membrane lipoprotein Blc n=1 Tax=Saccharobesus litoralis TaxID=2172099 RepID=A0A2S0VVM9_9ALTE|nr:lipocalin family protein [Saccharobesus litoralis]AWB68277.1 lipocalin [Saccharobesus litoralis]
MRLLLFTFVLLLCSCTGLPNNVTPINNFQLQRYLGTWYEIARLDHSFERGLSQVSASYSMRSDGGVRVLNKGFNSEDGRWQQAEGKAYFVQDETTGHLKVSFFGPFYASYTIFELDANYQTAFVAGYSKDYLWLLARTPQVDERTKQKFIQNAKDKGFATEQLIWLN